MNGSSGKERRTGHSGRVGKLTGYSGTKWINRLCIVGQKE